MEKSRFTDSNIEKRVVFKKGDRVLLVNDPNRGPGIIYGGPLLKGKRAFYIVRWPWSNTSIKNRLLEGLPVDLGSTPPQPFAENQLLAYADDRLL